MPLPRWYCRPGKQCSSKSLQHCMFVPSILHAVKPAASTYLLDVSNARAIDMSP